ncbi:MAG: hypothetical protein ACOYO1_17965 [Bacteroidales bacterium]
MKKINLFFIAALAIFLFSCGNPQKKAISEYCNCLNSILTDSIYSYEIATIIEKKCYDSLILKNKSLSEDKEFIDGFYKNEQIIKLQDQIKEKIKDNVQTILTKYPFTTNLDNYYQIHKFIFDGKIVKYSVWQMDLRGSYEKNIESRTYTVSAEKNGKTYIEMETSEGKSKIYEFGKNKDNNYYLDGPNSRFFAQKEKK